MKINPNGKFRLKMFNLNKLNYVAVFVLAMLVPVMSLGAGGSNIYSDIDRVVQERLTNADVPDLKSETETLKEIRVIRVAEGLIGGYILRETVSGWEASKLKLIPPVKRGRAAKPKAVQPKIPLPQLWKELTERDILTFPDDTHPEKHPLLAEGIIVVVEIKNGKHHRYYHILDPELQWAEGQKMWRIIDILQNSLEPLWDKKTGRPI